MATKKETKDNEGPQPGPHSGTQEFNEAVEAGERIHPPDPTGPSPGSGVTSSKKTASTKEEEDLSDYTVDELKEIADKEGAEVTSDMRKDDIIKSIKKNRK
jgi:hypothetical protein